MVTMRWFDRGVSKAASYLVEDFAGLRRLVRRYCENQELQNTEQVMADSLAGAADAVVVTCAPDPPVPPDLDECDETVTISVTDAAHVASSVPAAERELRTKYSVTGKRRVEG